ncbi:MAG: FAD-dependent oxidoreductase [Candidatus Methanomethylicia archaeon]
MLNYLFKPITIGGVELKNRIVMPGLMMGYADSDGSVTNQLINFYVERAKGGVGLITVGGAYPELRGKTHPGMLGIHSDSLINGYRELTDSIKKFGSKVILQILHGGRYARSSVSGIQPIAPSSIPSRLTGEIPREINREEIREVEKNYGEAAYRAYQAGFDGVEILAGTGYLISEFLSPVTNKRTDEYGGSLENRVRFLVEIIEEVKKKTPSRFIVGCRISAEEYMDGGNTINEAKTIVKRLEELGIHYVSVVAGWHESQRPLITREVPQGGFVDLAYEIKRNTSLPVIACIRIKNPVIADKIIGDGKADMVSMGRALIADPELPRKAFEGRINEIRPCIGCVHCLSVVFQGLRVECTVNPRLGMKETEINPTRNTRKILVIGAGPAGLEAAVTAASIGHKVVVIDKGESIGGMLKIASKPPYKEELHDLIDFYNTIINKYGVKVVLNREADEDYVKSLNPDIIILALGASPIIPDIPGVNLPHVRTAIEVLEKKLTLIGNIVVIGGGGIGLETADYITSKGGNVTIIEMLSRVGLDLDLAVRWIILKRLREKGVKILTETRVKEITSNSVIVDIGREQFKIETDHVVLAVGMRPNNKLAENLSRIGYKTYMIGDCIKPARILEAVRDGYRVGINI